jgi:hypothetical protein
MKLVELAKALEAINNAQRTTVISLVVLIKMSIKKRMKCKVVFGSPYILM